MTDAARRLIEQAMELSAEERLRVAEELVESVRDASEPGWDATDHVNGIDHPTP